MHMLKVTALAAGLLLACAGAAEARLRILELRGTFANCGFSDCGYLADKPPTPLSGKEFLIEFEWNPWHTSISTYNDDELRVYDARLRVKVDGLQWDINHHDSYEAYIRHGGGFHKYDFESEERDFEITLGPSLPYDPKLPYPDTGISGYIYHRFSYVSGSSPRAKLNLDSASIIIGVPEPSTWAMMIVGFGLVGGALRRSRRLLAT